jgi:hypothetical protein
MINWLARDAYATPLLADQGCHLRDDSGQTLKFMRKTNTHKPALASCAEALWVCGAGNACLTMCLRNEKVLKPFVSHRIIRWNPTTAAARTIFWCAGCLAMHEHVILLMKLGQIASEPCSGDERASHALALLNTYTTRLYARCGIGASNRLAINAKSFADQTLADLRREILAAEIRAADSYRKVFTAVRHRIEMARRVLASRIADENVVDYRPDRFRAESSAKAHYDAQSVDTMRRGQRDRVQVTERRAPIEGSIDLVRTVQLGRTLHRPCRRARFGNLSGQLTI